MWPGPPRVVAAICSPPVRELPASANGAERARRSSGAGRSLFGGGGASDVFAAPAASARSGGGDLFGSAAAAPAAEESRWPSSGAAAAGHDGGRVESLTGQRHENSVLFSLSNLQSLAMPAAKPSASAASSAPTTEGSGLIDIRAMAATTLGSSSGGSPGFGGFGGGGSSAADNLPAFGAFSPAAPVLLPLSSRSGPPAWVYIVIALFAVAIAGIGLTAYKVLSAKSPVLVEQVQQVPAPPEPAKAAPAAPAADPGAKPTTIAEENLPPRAGSSEAKGSEKSEKSDKGEHEHEHHHGKGKESGKRGDDKKGSAAAAVAVNSEPAEKKPAKGSLDNLIDGAVSSRHSGGGHAKVSDDDSKAAAPAGPLSKSAVVAGMNSVKPKIGACYSEFKVPGMAMVNVVIGKSGKVTSATVTGKFAGTPTGSCVEKAVKSASFPPSDGLQTPYPFQLR